MLDKKVQNIYYEFLSQKVSDNIIIVEVDERTLQTLGRFPFDRKVYVPFLENLKKASVGVIAFDIIFADRTNNESDIAFASSVKAAGNVIFGASALESGFIEKPLDILYESIGGFGYVRPNVDKKTGTVYSITPSATFRSGETFEHFSLAILRAYYNFIYDNKYISWKPSIQENQFYITPNVSAPLARNGKNELLINYASRSHFHRISFIDVYDTQSFEALQNTDTFKKKIGTLEDKIVIVGAAAKGIKDVFNTPSGIEYGVYTHANMVNTVLTGSFLKYFDIKLEWLLVFLLILVSVYFNLSRSGYVLIFSNIAIVALFLIIFPASVMIFTNLILNYSVELVFALIFSLTFTNILKYLIENKNKQKLNKALSEYVSEDVANEILSGAGKVNLDGENKRVALFFSDIEGFTSISEKFTPEVLVGFLREYLSEMSNIILDAKGFINKYEGDAIMALWGVFGNDKYSAYHACISAIKQQRLLGELNKDRIQRGFAEIKVRIGLHIGEAIIGNIGSQGRKMEFTALGDHVNLASRMEGVNKFYGTYICVSEDVYDETKDSFEFRYLDIIRVKGKQKGVKIYELIEEKGKLSESQRNLGEKFSQAISLYQERNFQQAKEIFESLVGLGDAPSNTYLERCGMYIKNPPSENWDGIWTMQSK